MKKPKNYTLSKGFTIMEMLIVVAIIAILVAVSIPNLLSSLARARKAACDENLHVIKHTYVAAALLDDRADYAAALHKAIADSNGSLSDITTPAPADGVITATCTGLCPSDGTYTIKISAADGAYLSGVCSEHSGDEKAKITTVKGTAAAAQLMEAFNSLILSDKELLKSSSRFDSNGTRLTQNIKKELEKMGYKIDDNTMWRIVPKDESFEQFCIYIVDLTAEQKKQIDNYAFSQTVTGTQVYIENGVLKETINDANIYFGKTTANDSTYSVITNLPGNYKNES